MNCIFQQDENNSRKKFCKCGRVIFTDSPPHKIIANNCGLKTTNSLLIVELKTKEKKTAPKMERPSFFKQTKSLLSAVKDFVSDGCSLVDKTEYQRRLEICNTCPQKNNDRCGVCNCILAIKAQAKVWHCPINKW